MHSFCHYQFYSNVINIYHTVLGITSICMLFTAYSQLYCFCVCSKNTINQDVHKWFDAQGAALYLHCMMLNHRWFESLLYFLTLPVFKLHKQTMQIKTVSIPRTVGVTEGLWMPELDASIISAINCSCA